jgi:hypothetical protein
VIRRLSRCFWLTAVLGAVLLTATGTASSAIEPPWCGTPIPDAAASLPTTGPGNFAHIPWYAVGCTLDSIAAQSNGRMKVVVNGQSALGREKYFVMINELGTKAQRRDYSNWQKIRGYALDNPGKAQKTLAKLGGEVKVPLYIQGGIHGNEYEGVDASMQLIERLATTPYGTDPEVDQILDHAILIFNPIQNPDGRIAGTRANGNGFDLNRDFLTQSQPETLSSVKIMQDWLPPDMLDMHGYVTPTLIEATTKPHNPGIEYDLWLKWNQSRIDANEALMNANGFQITRPINDWCYSGDIPVNGVCPGPPELADHWGPRWAESWDDWGPFYTPMYSQLVGLNGSTVEMCNSTSTVPGSNPPSTPCGPPVSDNARIGRLGARRAQYLTGWSTLLFDTRNRVDLLNDELEIYSRGVNDAPRPTTADLPPGFDNVENNWMHEYPKAYVIPVGAGQRSDPEAGRLVRWLLANGIRLEQVKKDYEYGSTTLESGSYVVWMNQALRGLADTALGPGVNVSSRISILYAPPGAWSHGYLWGADTVSIPDAATFAPKTKPTDSASNTPGGVVAATNAIRFALALDSPTAVRTLNGLLADGVTAELATVPFANALGEQMPAGTVLLPASAQNALAGAGAASGVWFTGVTGTLPAREPLAAPRIAVLAGGITQEIWSLRNLGFTADPVSLATINTAPTDPLLNYDVIFNTLSTYPADTPANATGRARLANFFATGGGYVGGLTNGANFLTGGGQVAGLTAANRGGAGRSGIINWGNTASGTGLITGAYPETDAAIVDPPTWFTSVPGTMTKDGILPLVSDFSFFLAGLWPNDALSASAPGSTVIAHGTNTAATARITSFAMNPLYRADPEREWPMLASAVYWVDN